MADVVVQQPIRSVYKDGSIVVSNVKSKVDNSTTSYSVVNAWYDGTPMDDSKVDQWGVYTKYKATGEYLRENKPQWGELFIEIDTVGELRGMSAYNKFLINIGYYKGVRLLGYYVKGDTPAAITYFLSNTNELDDGGSVFIIDGLKLEYKIAYELDIRYFGCKSEPNFDNSTFLGNITSYLKKNKNKIVIVDSKNGEDYETSSTFILPIDTDIYMNSFFVFTNDNSSKGMQVGDPQNYNFRRNSSIKVKRKSLSDWEDKRNIGVEIWNLYESINFNIQASQNFTTGVKFIADTKGCVYNTISVGVITNSRYQFVLSNVNLGWCNENLIYINRLQNTSAAPANKSRFGIIVTSDDNNYDNNNNVFYKPSIELASKIGYECRAIVVENGRYNRFESVRNEFNSTGVNGNKVYLIKGRSSNNIINEGFGSPTSVTGLVEEQGLYATTSGLSIRGEIYESSKKPLIYDSGFLTNKVSQYNDTTVRASGFLKFGFNTTSAFELIATGVTINKSYVSISSSRGIGVTIDSSSCKKFYIKAYSLNNIYGRFNIRCYNSDKELLNNSSFEHVKGSPILSLTYSDTNFKSWRTGADADTVYFQVSDEVASIDVIISSVPQLTRFQIFGVDRLAQLLNSAAENLVANKIPSIEVTDNTFYWNDNSNTPYIGWLYSGGTWIPKLNNATTVSKGIVNQAIAQPNSSAADVPGIVSDLNALLAKLRSAGIISSI